MATERKCPECGHSLLRKTHGAYTVAYCVKCSYQINLNTGKVVYKNVLDTEPKQLANCPNCDAQLHIPKRKGIMQVMCPFCSYPWQFDTGPTDTSTSQWHTAWWYTTCPKCNKSVHVCKNEGPRKIICPHCHEIWRFHSDTGEHLPDAKLYGDNILITCPECGRKNRVPNKHSNLLITCPRCYHEFYLMGNPAFIKNETTSQFTNNSIKSENPTTNMNEHSLTNRYDNTILTACPQCGQKSRVPSRVQNSLITCGSCSHQFYPMGSSTGTKNGSTAQSAHNAANSTSNRTNYTNNTNTTQNVQAKYNTPTSKETTTQSVNTIRTITIKRLLHAHKALDYAGLKNAFVDNYPIHIFLDGKDLGFLPKHDAMTLQIDANEHILKPAIMAPNYMIPKGTDSYTVYYFNDKFQIGPVHDPFRDQLVEFIVQMFQGQGIRDRINDPNNRNHNVQLQISFDGIRLSWDLGKTRGLKQWLTGKQEEFISYENIGLRVLPEERRPGGYWEFIQTYAEQAILNDEKANMMHDQLGGFTFNTAKHKLF